MFLKVVAKKHIKNESGQSLVQFAILLPVLISMFCLILEAGRIFDAYVVINNAASECVRRIAEEDKKKYDDVVDGVLLDNYNDRLNLANMEFETDVVGGVQQENFYYMKNIHANPLPASFKYHDVRVEIRYKVKMITPISVALIGDEVELKASFTTRVGGSKIRK
ncbi:pilus assembly protein [Erysipelotrichaceae bacterium OH741_COT-311]|nr:pilus assembly protein [Erysipelotrichaceae bacterium OH741_COT-311]